MHTLIWIQCKFTCAHTHTQYLCIGSFSTPPAVFQYFQVYSYRPEVRGDGSGRCSSNNDAGALFSSSQLQNMDIHPVTQLTTQINKHTHTYKCMHSRALDVVTTHWTPCSWGILLQSWEWERGIRAVLPSRAQKAGWPWGSG